MSIIWPCDGIENKHGVCRGEDYMKTFCKSFREHKIKIINFDKKKIISLTKEQNESYLSKKIFYICKEKFKYQYTNDNNYCKVEDCCHYTGKYRGAVICN